MQHKKQLESSSRFLPGRLSGTRRAAVFRATLSVFYLAMCRPRRHGLGFKPSPQRCEKRGFFSKNTSSQGPIRQCVIALGGARRRRPPSPPVSAAPIGKNRQRSFDLSAVRRNYLRRIPSSCMRYPLIIVFSRVITFLFPTGRADSLHAAADVHSDHAGGRFADYCHGRAYGTAHSRVHIRHDPDLASRKRFLIADGFYLLLGNGLHHGIIEDRRIVFPSM